MDDSLTLRPALHDSSYHFRHLYTALFSLKYRLIIPLVWSPLLSTQYTVTQYSVHSTPLWTQYRVPSTPLPTSYGVFCNSELHVNCVRRWRFHSVDPPSDLVDFFRGRILRLRFHSVLTFSEFFRFICGRILPGVFFFSILKLGVPRLRGAST